VLEYPKFSLTSQEIKRIIEEEVLPYFEVVEAQAETKGICRDPDDDKIIACAVAGGAKYIVSGDKDLLDLSKYRGVRIISGSGFLKETM
jgi:putative PIN family toxin of toxin-antitoxin system